MKMKKIGLYLSAAQHGGGMYQYNLALLNALRALPRNKFSLEIVFSEPSWGRHLQTGDFTTTYVTNSLLGKELGNIWIMSGLPVGVWRRVSSYFNPIIKLIKNSDCDLWIFPNQDSFPCQVPVRSLYAIFDLNHRYARGFPELSGNGRYRYREQYLRASCKLADGILVDSEVSKQQVRESYAIPSGKIFVLPFIPPHYIFENARFYNENFLKELPEKYIFYPAQFWAHKNHISLLRAINKIKNVFPDIHLILVGAKHNSYLSVTQEIEKLGLQNQVHILGYVEDRYLPELFKRARAMVMPTYCGPTNIPPLEAFALGCPVAISSICSQQVGNAALTFDPYSVEEIAHCISQLWSDDELCEILRFRGIQKAKDWGEEQFGQKLCDIIDSL